MSSSGQSRLEWLCLVISIASISLKVLVVEALLLPSVLNARGHRSTSNGGNGQTWRHSSSIFRSSCIPVRPLHSLVINSEENSGNDVHALCSQDEKYWTLPRLYVGPRLNMPNSISLTPEAVVHLSSDQSHYLTNVMRILKKRKSKKSGGSSEVRDCIRIFNGKDGEWLAKVLTSAEQPNSSSSGSGKSRGRGRSPKRNRDISLVAQCILKLRASQVCEDDRPWMLFAPIRSRSRMKVMIEKCTELGVGRMIPVTSDHIEGGALMSLFESNSNEANRDIVYGGYKGSREKTQRASSFEKLEVQAIEAAEQCERLSIPSFLNDASFIHPSENSKDAIWKVKDLVEHWCDNWEESRQLNGGGDTFTTDSRTLLICRERGSGVDANDVRAKVVPLLQALHDNQRVSFLVGPEGGWSAEEELMFDEICSNYSGKTNPPVRSVSLGSSVLRAETACMMAVGAWALINDSQRKQEPPKQLL